MRHGNRGGFTLMEVLVALALGAMVLVGARGMLDGLGAHAAGVLHSARAADARENADDLLRRALADLIVRPDTIPSFDGDESAFAFRTNCDMPQGWQEPCEVRVTAERTDSGFQLLLRESAGAGVVLRRSLARPTLRYLFSADNGGAWTARWQSTVLVPRAVGIVTGDDTLVVRVGERR